MTSTGGNTDARFFVENAYSRRIFSIDGTRGSSSRMLTRDAFLVSTEGPSRQASPRDAQERERALRSPVSYDLLSNYTKSPVCALIARIGCKGGVSIGSSIKKKKNEACLAVARAFIFSHNVSGLPRLSNPVHGSQMSPFLVDSFFQCLGIVQEPGRAGKFNTRLATGEWEKSSCKRSVRVPSGFRYRVQNNKNKNDRRER